MKALHFLAPNSPKPAITNLKQQSSSAFTQTHIAFHRNKLSPVKNCANSSSNSDSNSNGSSDEAAQPPPPRAVAPPDGVEIRFKRGSRRRMRQDGFGEGQEVKKMAASSSEAGVKKKWEEMTVTEKAMELYMGDKGLLFWLNKFAYASIFIVIGGWILFRFVGPSLNLYQLETPPLSPSNIFKG